MFLRFVNNRLTLIPYLRTKVPSTYVRRYEGSLRIRSKVSILLRSYVPSSEYLDRYEGTFVRRYEGTYEGTKVFCVFETAPSCNNPDSDQTA